MSSLPTALNLQYYISLLTSEWQTATNEIAWLTANIQLFQDVETCAANFPQALSLNSAAGPQLDLVGGILGVARTVGFQPSGGVSPVLDDPTYRLLLTATVLKNHWGGTLSELRTIWNVLFPSGILLITDNQNMTCSLFVAAPLTSIVQDLLVNQYILPRPQGVFFTITIADLPMLGFGYNTGYIAGFEAFSTTATITSGSNTITVASASGITVGLYISAQNYIPANTTVTHVAGTTITLSQNATANGSGITVTSGGLFV